MAATAPGTPYVTPAVLTRAPTGISWSTIPGRNAAAADQLAEQTNLCVRATGMVDTTCNQVLRATVDSETLHGPDFRVTQRPNGVTRLVLSRWPVLQVLGGQVAPARPPLQWTPIDASMFASESPPIGIYGTSAPSDAGDGGQAVLLAPGYVSWLLGRNGYTIQVSYVNGWPHTALTADAVGGATTLEVDDCTGWAPVSPSTTGATGVVFDGALQETVTVTAASAQSGPGTLTLAGGLGNAHQAGALVTTLPMQIMWATILFAVAQALERGATATTVQQTPGAGVRLGAASAASAEEKARKLCLPFQRVI